MSIKKTPELIEKAQRLRDLGCSYRKIGNELGVSNQTIRCWLNPVAARKNAEKCRKWRKSNPEKCLADARHWAKHNPEKKRESNRKWEKTNRERLREYNTIWRKNNPERSLESSNKWKKNNPGKDLELKSRYRARRRNAAITLTLMEQSKMISIYENRPDGYDIDHIIPLSRGGLHHPLNLQYLPASVNRQKHTKIREEDIELFRYRLVNETADTDPMTFMDLIESLYCTSF